MKKVWPYLLGHYKFGSTVDERVELDILMQQKYEQTMSEWLIVEAIIHQQEKETTPVANIAKSSSESQDSHMIFVQKDSSLSNDVFESVDTDERTHPETVMEESPSALTPVHEQVMLDRMEPALEADDGIKGLDDNTCEGCFLKGFDKTVCLYLIILMFVQHLPTSFTNAPLRSKKLLWHSVFNTYCDIG